MRFTRTLAVVAMLVAPLAHAAKLTLDNGDQISGEVVGQQDQWLVFKSPLLGRLKIPLKQVVELRSDEGVQLELALPNQPVIDLSVKYSGHATLGGTFNRGNANDELLNLDAELVARTPDKRYAINLEINEARALGVVTSSRRRLAAQHDIFLSPQNYVFVNARARSDVLADLNLRTTLGSGYGRQIMENEQTKLSAEVGVSYIREDYEIAPERSYPALSLGLNYEQKFFDNALVFFNNTHLTSGYHESASTLVTNKLGIRVPIANGLNLTTQFNMAYDSSPPHGIKPTDSSLIFGVGYVF
jgi:putative salt-induced outer membrane protein YdiY